MPRHAFIEIDPAAITANVRTIAATVGNSIICAVVKADGYGHGSVLAARAALAGGASWLAVALVEEGQVLRDAGIDSPILLLSEPPADVMAEALAARLTPTIYTASGVEAARMAVRSVDLDSTWPVHLKIDTGMHRAGADPDSAVDIAHLISAAPELELGGTFTHLAVADEPDRPETETQLRRFGSVLHDMRVAGINPGIVHASNSAGALRWNDARFDMVRVGISIYGYSPFGMDSPESAILRPALSLRSELSMVRKLSAGESVSYGLRHTFDRDTTVGVVPLGYADGVDRRLGLAGGVVLVDGAPQPVRGVVTMDQLIVELANGTEGSRGDEVVLIGTQRGATITADHWAELLGTIPYEVLCRFGPRVRRVVRAEPGNTGPGGDPTGSEPVGERDPVATDSISRRHG